MATEAFIQKRDVSWDVSVGGSTVQIRVLSASDKIAAVDLVRQALERIALVSPRDDEPVDAPIGVRSAYTNNLSAQVKQNYKP